MCVKKVFFMILIALLVSGCAVFDVVFSGERRLPLSKYAYDQYEAQNNKIRVRLVYNQGRTDVFTYVVGFDGTNNSGDCDVALGVEPGLIDWVTNKPGCTTVKRLKEEIADVGFSDQNAARLMRYYDGPGSAFGRFSNPLDSLFGYTSLSISDRALRQFWADVDNLPATIKEIRLVVIGFSRGAAIARHFVNRAHGEWTSSKLERSGVVLWSTMLLNETVATFQEDNLELTIPPQTEQVIHILAKNESRIEFRPIVDEAVGLGAEMDRLVTIWLPGAHSDIGGGYRYGAGVFSDYATHRVAQEMGLIDVLSKNYGTLPNYGLVDSRGWRDRLSGTPSGYSCGFDRVVAEREKMILSDAEFDRYRRRLLSRGRSIREDLFASKGANIQNTFVFEASASSNNWRIVPHNIPGVEMGTRATLLKESSGEFILNILDGINIGKTIILPQEVVSEINSYHGKPVQVEIAGMQNVRSNTTREGFWFFVNGCLPADGITVKGAAN